MSYFLHIETATEVCSVCVSEETKILAHQTATEPQVHTRQATLMIEEVMRQSKLAYPQLSAIVVSNGPGSYTGLRVGSSIAKGLCYGLDIPMITINTLEALYLASFEAHNEVNSLYIPMIDARRMEVYLAKYNGQGHCIQENTPFILESDSFDHELATYDSIVFSGNGCAKYAEVTHKEQFLFTNIICDAKHLVKPGIRAYQAEKFDNIAYSSPNYIKLPNITKSKKKLL